MIEPPLLAGGLRRAGRGVEVEDPRRADVVLEAVVDRSQVQDLLIETDRIHIPGPTPGVDAWWSGKHKHHGGNIQIVSAPDGWPPWIAGVRPGREHDTTAARTDPVLLQRIRDRVDDGGTALADLGHEGEAGLLDIPIKKTEGSALTVDQQSYDAVHGALPALGERANSLLKTTFKVLRRIRGRPWRIGDITAALVLLHHEHGRTT